MTKKLYSQVSSLDYVCRPCNYNSTCKIEGKCAYGGRCRHTGIVYEIKCKRTGKSYIGCTQQTFKSRMSGHFADVKKYVRDGVQSDTYAKHFQQFFDKSTLPTPTYLREMSKFKILWRGGIISMMKSFGTNWCKLCMKERIEILHRTYKDKGNLINSNCEIYGACKHKASFHRYKIEESPRGHLATA